MVSGMPPGDRNEDEKPPPRKYSTAAGTHFVARIVASMSFCVMSHHGLKTLLPFAFISPAASSVQLPELSRWMMPCLARPFSPLPVARFTDSLFQKVRTSANMAARFVSKYMSSMQTPLRESFSVAIRYGARAPFQSKDVFSIASRKSPFGQWSVHWRCPWKPARIALRPTASSPKPISPSLGLPTIMSRTTIAIFTTYSQSRSFASRLFWMAFGL